MPPNNNRRNAQRRQKRIPLFARTYPLLYKLFLVSAQFTTPLTLLTIASTSTVLQQKLSYPSLLGTPGSGSSSTWRFPFILAAGVGAGPHTTDGSKAGLCLGLNWRKTSVWLWYLSLWTYIARYALIGTSVVWVLSGWEDGGDVVERENGGDGMRV